MTYELTYEQGFKGAIDEAPYISYDELSDRLDYAYKVSDNMSDDDELRPYWCGRAIGFTHARIALY